MAFFYKLMSIYLTIIRCGFTRVFISWSDEHARQS